MARRNQHTEEELPFVALMDTLTNVVGVLVIVLVMIGIGLAKAVNKVLSDLPMVSQVEFEKLQKAVTALPTPVDPKDIEEKIKKSDEKLKKLGEEIKHLEYHAPEDKTQQILDLEKQIADRKKERDAKKTNIEALMAEVDKLKKQLDTTPVFVPPDGIVVRMPNPRPIPDKASFEHFTIAGDRIVHFNPSDYVALAVKELTNNKMTMSLGEETVKGPDGKPLVRIDKFGKSFNVRRTVYDPKKVTEFFTRARLNGQSLSMTGKKISINATVQSNSPTIMANFTIGDDAGESVTQAKNLASEYQGLLNKFKSDKNKVAFFHIYNNSIPTYLAAREMADARGIPATWDFCNSLVTSVPLPPEFSVAHTPPPTPPPTPTPQPTPVNPSATPAPTPINIPMPKQTLD